MGRARARVWVFGRLDPFNLFTLKKKHRHVARTGSVCWRKMETLSYKKRGRIELWSPSTTSTFESPPYTAWSARE